MALAPPILGVIIWTIICGAAIVLINVAKIGRYINKDNAGCVCGGGMVPFGGVRRCWGLDIDLKPPPHRCISTYSPTHSIAVVWTITAGIATYLMWCVHSCVPHAAVGDGV